MVAVEQKRKMSVEEFGQEYAGKPYEWLSAGVSVGWVVDPQRRVVEMFQAGKPLQVLREGDVLAAEEVLPGFQLPVQEIFAGIEGN